MTEFANYPSLQGRTVFVTGGASGIGAEMLRAFAGAGARVGFVDFDAQAAQAMATETGAEFVQADLRDIEALRSAFGRLIERMGAPYALVNNAARDDRHEWEEVTEAYFDERIATNLRHMFFATQAVAPAMIKAGKGGSVVMMGSNSWWESSGGMPVYTTSKAGVHGMARSFARDLGGHGIRCNTVVPGWIMTERQKTLWVTPEAIAKHLDRQCLKEPVDPVYVARMVLWLCSDDARMCTASNFFVDGGSV